MRRSITSKALSLLLVLVLTVAMIPVAVFATNVEPTESTLTFDSVEENSGYNSQTKTITVTASAGSTVTAELSDDTAFELDGIDAQGIVIATAGDTASAGGTASEGNTATSGTTSFDVKTKTDLDAYGYTATLTVTVDGVEAATYDLLFTVNAADVPTTYYDVDFDTNGGSANPQTQSIADGGKVVKPADPTRDGLIFDGWYLDDPDYGQLWDFDNDTVDLPITLVAKWSLPVSAKTIAIGSFGTYSDTKVSEIYSYGMVVSESLFNADGSLKFAFTTANVTVTSVSGGVAYHPSYVEIYGWKNSTNNHHLFMQFSSRLADGDYTVSITGVDGWNFDIGNNAVTVSTYTKTPKPVIDIGNPNADGKVDVTITVDDPGYFDGYTVNDEWQALQGQETSYTFTISPTEPDEYPTKYIVVDAYGADESSRAVKSYTFQPAADAFQVKITKATSFTTIEDGGKTYRVLATLAALNASGSVTYEIDKDFWVDYTIIGNNICVEESNGSGDSDWAYYQNGIWSDGEEGNLESFNGEYVFVIGTDSAGNKAYANDLLNWYDDDDDDDDDVEPVEPSNPSNPSGNGSSSSSSSGGGGGGSNPATIPSANVNANGSVNQGSAVSDLNKAIKAAATDGSNTAVVKVQNAQSISPSTIKALADAAKKAGTEAVVYADKLGADGTIQARIYLEPAKLTGVKEDIKLGVETQGARPEARKALFEKFFDNKVSVVSFEQTGSFGAKLKVAVKIDLPKNTDNLVFYSFDAKTGKYTKIDTTYRIDKNGYIHFETELAGDIIISDKPLKKK